uniref:Uncharacterized protein n=1 Tax=Manihot esculenta TaxID=3983 RepID=A0A2C9U1I0_MANES
MKMEETSRPLVLNTSDGDFGYAFLAYVMWPDSKKPDEYIMRVVQLTLLLLLLSLCFPL